MLRKPYFSLLLLFCLTSCTEDVMDRINRCDSNPEAPAVGAALQLTDAIVSTAFTTYGGEYAWHAGSYTEQIFGTGNAALMETELRMSSQTAAATTFNNAWNGTYANLMNISAMLTKSHDAGAADIEGMGHVLWCLNFEALTELHGDIPYSRALGKERQPALDRQEDIYRDLCRHIDEAIALLGKAVESRTDNAGRQDVLYGGDAGRWLALAHAVKARLWLNLSFRDASGIAKAADAADAALAAGFEGAELDFFNGTAADNSWYSYQQARFYTGANSTVAALMEERSDPRLAVYAADVFGTGTSCAPAGDESLAQAVQQVGYPLWLNNDAATIHILSLSELRFIAAEAKMRSGADATADFEAGIRASFADYAAASDTEPADASAYIASLGKATLSEVMVQKYLAASRDEIVQTYNDIRRCRAMGEEYVALHNPNNSLEGENRWPLRLPYGNSDVVSNPHVAAAFGNGNAAGAYIFTDPVWLFTPAR